MSEQEEQPTDDSESADSATAVETDAADEASAADQASAAEDTPAAEDSQAESVPEFQPLRATGRSTDGNFELNRFGGVQVVLTAELGRTQLTLQELMSLSEGAVLELHRAISEPVELMAQGVPLGNAEVVVVDDQFAIRVKEIYSN
ncbi:MAG: FliM/FliN family flagellar motor switch protein [Planctomycetota bacterium]